ncbi:MAG: 30S ribosomal protein S2, partial [Woeseiaceae bacterium]
EKMAEEDGFEGLTKKEILGLSREQEKLERSLGGIKHMRSLPDILFVVDVDHEDIAIREARKLGIPVVAIVDTNCSPEGVDYIVPGNDDAMRAIELYSTVMADAVLDGKASLPEVALGEDEFVELDEDGKPKKTRAKKKTAKKKSAKKTAVKKKAAVRKKAPVKKVEAEADAGDKAEVKAEAKAEEAAETKTEAKAEKTAETKADAKAEKTAETKADAKTEKTAETKAEAKAEKTAESKADAKTDAQADVKEG